MTSRNVFAPTVYDVRLEYLVTELGFSYEFAFEQCEAEFSNGCEE
jgi:metal-sulfur cluster biosynthetic enzyme